MMDAFGSWLLQNYPWIIFLSVGIFIGIVANRLFQRFKKVEQICDKMSDIEKSARLYEQASLRIEKSIDKKLLPSIEKTNDRIDSVVISLNNIKVYMSFKDKDFDKDLVVAKSPIQLTEMGLAILKCVGGDTYIDQNADRLIQEFDKSKINSALDVQNQAVLVIMDQTGTDGFIPIKDYIYHHPAFKMNDREVMLNINIAILVMAIYLRNKYLDVHPELLRSSTTA